MENEASVAQPAEAEVTEAPAAETPTETPSEQESLSHEDKWDKLEFKFDKPDESESAEQVEPETPSPPVPDESEAEQDTSETDETEEPEPSDSGIPETAFKLNRKDLRKAEAQVITPFRDPETPISDVLKSFYEFHPKRTEQLVNEIVKDSAENYPDQWISAITGIDGLTVDKVKQAVEGTPNAPVLLTDKPEIQNAIANLTEVYGDAWKDPANDDDLIGDDAQYVPMLRTMLEPNAERDTELENLRTQLAELKPQVDEIKTARETEFEQKFESAYKSSVETYRKSVEDKAIPTLLKESGIEISPDDIPEVKGVKEAAMALFQPVYEGYSSDFDMFVTQGFSGKEGLMKVVSRVDTYLADAEKAALQATRAKGADVERYQKQAASLKRQAEMEKDALTVLTQKAAKEFLASPKVAPMVKLLEINADLKRRLQQGGRAELIGSTAAPNGNSFQDKVKAAAKDGINPFDTDLFETNMASATRQ